MTSTKLEVPVMASSSVSPQAISYWRKQLSNPPALALPTDYHRFSGQVIEAELGQSINSDVCTAVLKYSLFNNRRPYTLVLAAFAIVLHKYTRENDLLIGSSTNDCNPLALRLQVEGSATLAELVDRVQAVEVEALEHDMPFDQILADLAEHFPADNATHGPRTSLLQVGCLNAVDVKTETLEAISSCDWTMFVEQEADSKRLLPLRLRLKYNTVVFTHERVEELLAQLEAVLASIASYPDTAVRDVSLFLPATEACKHLPDPTAMLDSSWKGSIVDYLADWADKDPERMAVHEEGQAYTYGYVNAASNRLAHYLLGHGIQTEDVVALYAHHSTALVVGIMGILKAGATFSVIDPAYPIERQQTYLSVARPKAIVQLRLAGPMNEAVQKYVDTQLAVVCQLKDLNIEMTGELATYSVMNPRVAIGPDNIATLSFTSGSTGVPKGVLGRHVSLTHFYPWMADRFGMSAKDRFTMLSGIAHDPIQRDVFTPLFLGASLYVPRAEDIMEPGQLAVWMAANQITVSHLTPAMNQLLTANATQEMNALRLVFLVGDILTRRDALRLQSLAHNVRVVNMYGTTETQRAVSCFEIVNSHQIQNSKEILPAGQGMQDVQLLVIAANEKMAGVGELGEIFVRSPHLAKGYLGLEEATAAKFITNPFTNQQTDRMYRTGDLGRYTPMGIVECVGRTDDQVKIRGFRIELGEIDTFLGQHSDVRENVTLVRRDENEEKRIVSYFVPTTAAYDIARIREWMKEHLPAYSVPSVFCPLTRMPLTPNGKIDKARLPFPDSVVIAQQMRGGSGEEESVALTPIQAKVLNVWKQILGHSVGINDNFFDIGGHSLAATRVAFELRKLLRSDIPLNMIYRFPTISQLAARIRVVEMDPTASFDEDEMDTAAESLDLEAEVQLDQSVTTSALEPFDAQAPITGVLLTGATGFLGAFLLSSLHSKFPLATIYCLVRASTATEAKKRVIDNLKGLLLWSNDIEDAVIGVPGDLAQPDCGLSHADWTTLARETSMIVHNGAWVHWVYPYAKLRASNVLSTQALLRLATSEKLKSFHFVSSTAVFESSHYLSLSVPVQENTPLVAGNAIPTGYGQSKWVSERMVMLARERGVPTTIFRPGYITGDSTTGVSNTDDYLVRLAKGCLELGQAPVMVNRVNMCPVDFVAHAMTHIMPKASAQGRCFHFVNPAIFRFSDYFGALTKYGYDMAMVDYVDWRQALQSHTLGSKDSALFPLLHFVLDDLPIKSKSAQLDATELFDQLADSNIRCPAINDVIGTYLAFLVHIKHIPPPTKAGSSVKPLPLLHLGQDVRAVRRTGA